MKAELRLQRGVLLFSAKATAVAQRAGVSRTMVYKWRRDPSYEQGLYWLWGRLLARSMREEGRRPQLVAPNKRQLHAWIGTRVRNQWTGPIVSPLDNKTYTSIEAYAEHLKSHDAFLAEDAEAYYGRQRSSAAKSGIRLTERVLQKLFA